MEEELCICFYSFVCCLICCLPEEKPLSSEKPVITVNPGSQTGDSKLEPLKNESDLNKDGLAL